MKLKKKILTGILAVSMACIILQPNKAKAALQSNGGTSTTKIVSDWMLQIRQMQELGGTLGRTDTIDTTNLKSNATDLDIHMEKNTEYGAMAILSASAYGNPNPIADGGTTTGNSTGIVIKLNKEFVAAGKSDYVANNFKIAANRYKNIYEIPYSAKIGDAVIETKNWHSESTFAWTDARGSANLGVLRAYSGSVFSYYHSGSAQNGIIVGGEGWYSQKWSTRACIVVGTGI